MTATVDKCSKEHRTSVFWQDLGVLNGLYKQLEEVEGAFFPLLLQFASLAFQFQLDMFQMLLFHLVSFDLYLTHNTKCY